MAFCETFMGDGPRRKLIPFNSFRTLTATRKVNHVDSRESGTWEMKLPFFRFKIVKTVFAKEKSSRNPHIEGVRPESSPMCKFLSRIVLERQLQPDTFFSEVPKKRRVPCYGVSVVTNASTRVDSNMIDN
ncbi:hypothetical protein EVAR_56933_1 [Eumeta japonica]|uniref:Uncharacterized protein n=1 Tax=Eumeta variegata TaxID=151549 RepID=A0A4C1YGI9_EUMVA|nr:hypothetical protein EVAR_56933_1 [Eumeta japonica]